MIQIELNGKNMKTREETHKYLKEKLNLPEYYGENLDALWDILSTYSKPIKISFINKDELIKNLEDYGYALISVFQDVEEENTNIKFEIIY